MLGRELLQVITCFHFIEEIALNEFSTKLEKKTIKHTFHIHMSTPTVVDKYSYCLRQDQRNRFILYTFIKDR